MKWFDIIVWILFMIALAVSLWFIFGNSPTFEQTILVLIVTFLFTLHAKIISYGNRLDSISFKFEKLENSFVRLVDDFKKLNIGRKNV